MNGELIDGRRFADAGGRKKRLRDGEDRSAAGFLEKLAPLLESLVSSDLFRKR